MVWGLKLIVMLDFSSVWSEHIVCREKIVRNLSIFDSKKYLLLVNWIALISYSHCKFIDKYCFRCFCAYTLLSGLLFQSILLVSPSLFYFILFLGNINFGLCILTHNHRMLLVVPISACSFFFFFDTLAAYWLFSIIGRWGPLLLYFWSNTAGILWKPTCVYFFLSFLSFKKSSQWIRGPVITLYYVVLERVLWSWGT